MEEISYTKTGRYKLQKMINFLELKKGRHTELVSVYVPAGYNIHEIISQLKSEQSTSENIKSKQVRKNVTTALEKIMRHLQLYKKLPENGLALFSGDVSDTEGQGNVEIWSIEPPEKLKTKLYWCDQKFVMHPLIDMIDDKEIYGIISMDKSDFAIAILKGKKITLINHMESIVPGKTRAGGQSSARFSRVREGMLNDWYKQIGEVVNKVFEKEKDIKGILLGGSGPIKEYFLKGDFIHNNIRKKILGTVDTSYTGDLALNETIERGEALIKEADIIKEKVILKRFLEGLGKDSGLVCYGFEKVEKALALGAVDTLIISEGVDMLMVEYECKCDKIKTKMVTLSEKLNQKCENCNSIMGTLGEKDIIEYFDEKVNDYGSKLEIVSEDTVEGKSFLSLSGIGAILRYEIE